jgi:hypothetical protein
VVAKRAESDVATVLSTWKYIDKQDNSTLFFCHFNILDRVSVLRLAHLKPETLMGVQSEMRLRPNLLLRLSARRRLPACRGVRFGRLSIGSESNGVESLQQTN